MGTKKQLAILGSTGSIGTQALQVVAEHSDLFEVYALTANRNIDLLAEQARRFSPEAVVIADKSLYPRLKEALSDLPIKVYAGSEAIAQIVEAQPIDMVLTAMIGYAGLYPTIKAIEAGKAIALANKETLVVAGELITGLALEKRVPIIPVDSEHSGDFPMSIGRKQQPHRENHSYGSEVFPESLGRETEICYQKRSFETPQLENGSQNHNRFGIDDEQGI